MTSFFYARHPVSGALLATLPCSMLGPDAALTQPGVARRLRALFVSAGRLAQDEAERVDFEVHHSIVGRPPAGRPRAH